MKFAIVLSTDTTRFDAATFQGNFEENAALIAGLGYQGVELAVRDPALIDLAAIAQVLSKHNLAVPAIGTGQAYGEEKLSFTSVDQEVRRQAIERIKAQIRLAAEFEAVVILGLIRGVVGPGLTYSQAMDWLTLALQECAETAGSFGVRLAIEPINRQETNLINTIDEALVLLSQVGAAPSTLGLLPDTYHMNIEEPSIEESLRQAATHLFHFHVADSNRCYPGAGDLNFREILSQLRDELGYQGWVSAETLPFPEAATAARRGLTHLQACLSRS